MLFHLTELTERNSKGCYICLCRVLMMFKTVDVPSDCDVRAVIHLFNARNMRLTEIDRKIFEVKRDIGISDRIIRRWV